LGDTWIFGNAGGSLLFSLRENQVPPVDASAPLPNDRSAVSIAAFGMMKASIHPSTTAAGYISWLANSGCGSTADAGPHMRASAITDSPTEGVL
jgi:hypothetical protein